MKALFILLAALLTNTSIYGQSSGFFGRVTEVIGNQMPSTTLQSKGTPKGAPREIFIYELTSQKQATKEGVFYKNVTSKLIAKKKTNADGSFKIRLKPGRYSVFVEEKDGLFANSFDGEGNINPLTIEPKKMIELDLKVDYKAAY